MSLMTNVCHGCRAWTSMTPTPPDAKGKFTPAYCYACTVAGKAVAIDAQESMEPHAQARYRNAEVEAERRFADQVAGAARRMEHTSGWAATPVVASSDPRSGERRAPSINLKSRAAVADVMEKVFASVDEVAFRRARDQVFEQCRKLREAGQKEYAHDSSNAFANFEEDEKDFGITREMDLLIFANKHWRGVRAWARGHRSQREDVRGRIGDLVVYLVILRAMADEREQVQPDVPQPKRSG